MGPSGSVVEFVVVDVQLRFSYYRESRSWRVSLDADYRFKLDAPLDSLLRDE